MCGPWYVPTATRDHIFSNSFFALFMQHNPFTEMIVQVITCCHLSIALLSCVKEMMVTCIIYIIGKFEKIVKKLKRKIEKKLKKLRSCAALGTYQQLHVTLFYFQFFQFYFHTFPAIQSIYRGDCTSNYLLLFT